MCCFMCMQVQFLHEKFTSLDIEVDGGLSPSTIDTAAQVCVCVPYSGKFSLGANFRDFRGQTCFCENKNRKKKCTKMEIDDVVHRYELVPM